METKRETLWTVGLTWLLLAIALAFAVSCTTTRTVTVPVVERDTVYQSKVMRDSIYLHDSVRVEIKGDSVMIERWHTRWRDRLRTDTVYKHQIDSIPYPVEVVKEVEREFTRWEVFQMNLAKVLMAVTVVGLLLWLWGRKR